MAFNKYMHPRNCYKNNPPDFVELAKNFPSFKRHVKYGRAGKPYVDFRNPRVVRDLTTCLLEQDFKLKMKLADDRLAPTLPLRLNYILWLEDLLKCLPSKETYCVLDIGCGGSCIYPLLGVRVNSSLQFVGSEVDEKNFQYATNNVARNELREKIKIIKVDKDDALLCVKAFDACMCNPPFFIDETDAKIEHGRPTPNSTCSGSNSEIFGGDLQYAQKIFDESLNIEEKCKWYTVMFGKKSSFVKMKRFLGDRNVKTLACTEFCQGQTMRWAIAWSFFEIDVSSLPKSLRSKEKKPLVISTRFKSTETASDFVKVVLRDLNIDYSEDEGGFVLAGNICENIPNRKARRLKKHLSEDDAHPPSKKIARLEKCDDAFANVVTCTLVLSHHEDGEIKILLNAKVGEFCDHLNRFATHLKQRLSM